MNAPALKSKQWLFWQVGGGLGPMAASRIISGNVRRSTFPVRSTATPTSATAEATSLKAKKSPAKPLREAFLWG
ncbi:MAG TPA: hypothetical protein VGX71_17360 [Pseudaminobacter sp.]|jgi:hypothetical protein|nr:hypothetical protein [Pseudaminobacter sp.]